MIVAILCGSPYSTYARDNLRELNDRGIRNVHVVAARPEERSGSRQSFAEWLAMPVTFMRRMVGRIRQMLKSSVPAPDSLEVAVPAQGGRLILLPDVNGEPCQKALAELGVELMLLGGAPIMKAPVLRVPKIGTLNAHQGALPRYRGMNVIEWALLERCPPTVTIHYVDPGVDTGDIVRMVPIPVQPQDTLQSVRARSSALQSRLLAEAVVSATRGPLSRQSQAKSDGKQFYAMHPFLRVVAEQHLQDYIHDMVRS